MRLPTRGRQFRNTALLFGAILFLWIPIEDFQTLPVVVFGTVLALLMLLGWTLGKLGGKTIPARYVLFSAALVGALAGLGAVMATVTLMFFKTALHAHPFPDYPPAQMLAMLERAPVWTLAGALLSVGVTLLWTALHDMKSTPPPASADETQTEQ